MQPSVLHFPPGGRLGLFLAVVCGGRVEEGQEEDFLMWFYRTIPLHVYSYFQDIEIDIALRNATQANEHYHVLPVSCNYERVFR